MSDRNIPTTVAKKLYAKSGNQCSFPGCTVLLYDDANIGQICHINGLKPGSARHDPSLSRKELNSYENLILLCPTHHDMVDQDEKTYTIEYLKQMKTDHESEVVQRMAASQTHNFFE